LQQSQPISLSDENKPARVEFCGKNILKFIFAAFKTPVFRHLNMVI